MSEILVELGKLTQASQEQTAASNALSQEVASKMAEIDQKAADAILPLGAIMVSYYVDPENGSDANVGSESAPLKSLDRAFALATAPEMNACTITINVKPVIDYHVSKGYNIHTRSIVINGWGADKANVYIDPYVVTSSSRWFATRGFAMYNASLDFSNCRVYLPMFSDIDGHDSKPTSSSGGIIRPVGTSIKIVSFSSSEVHIGDQFLVAPSPADTTFLHFRSTSLHLREGRTMVEEPITINEGQLMVIFYGTQLNDGLALREGSLFGGVKFKNGAPYNVLSNVQILEASA